MKPLFLFLTFSAALTANTTPKPGSVRVKEIASVAGVRDNQLVGYGLVVGLNGTGDKRQTVFSAQTLTNLLQRMGVQVSPTAIQVRNTAGVMITATLPPFSQPGNRIDVTVAAIGDATNLQGGLLVMTPLRAANGGVYAAAQGQVVTGGFVARGGGGANSMSVNHPTAGRIPSGAIVEQAAPSVLPSEVVQLQLKHADFTTASRVAESINKKFKAPVAHSDNSALVSVKMPEEYKNRTVDFLAEIENVSLDADKSAKVIVNERTGTIVLGKEVRIRPVAILHGNLGVEIQTTYEVSQPAPLSDGKTQVVPQVGIGVKEEKARQLLLKQGATVEDLVKALIGIGSTPRDVIAILQSLSAAGALEAELEVI